MASRWRTEAGTEINLAPLLDVIFSLLFFFILATSLRQERTALEVALPRTSQQPRPMQPPPESLEIEIGRDNRIVFQGNVLQGEELVQALNRARQEVIERTGRPVQEAIVRSDGQASVQAFVDVSDACLKAGLTLVQMEALPSGRADWRSDSPSNP